jgi:hypothetical protein
MVLTTSVFAQSLKQYIPEKSYYVMGVNWATLNQKISFDALNKELDSIKGENVTMEIFANVLSNPNVYGIDIKEQTYLFYDASDTFNNYVLVMGLSDKNKFESHCTEMLNTRYDNVAFKKDGQIRSFTDGKFSVGFTNDIAIFLFDESYRYSYNYDDAVEPEDESFDYWTERRAVRKQIDSLRFSGDDPYVDELNMEEPIDEEVEETDYDDAYDDYDEYVEETVEETIEEAVAAATEEDYDYAEDYSYNYDRHPLMRKLEAKRDSINAEKQRIRNIKITDQTRRSLGRYFKLDPKLTTAKNAKFNSIINKEHDLVFWLNPNLINAVFAKDIKRSLNRRRHYDDDELEEEEEAIPGVSKFEKLVSGNYSYAYGDFNQGSFKMSFKQEKNQELSEFEYVNVDKINPDILNYMGSETFGFWSMNLNIEAYFESYRKVMFALIESYPMEEYMIAQFEFMDILLNKDVFYNSLAGDGIIALTGLQTKIETREKYIYNEESFEQEWTEVTDTFLFPKILSAATIAKKENVDRIILAFEHMKLLRKEKEGVYEIIEYRGEGTGFYIAIKNNLFIVSNDKDLIFNNIEKGLPKNLTMQGEGRELLSKYGNCQYWNSEKSFDAILKIGTEFRPKDKGQIQVLQTHLANSNAFITKDGNVVSTNFNLNFSDSSVNSLLSLLTLMEEFSIIR